MSDAVTNGAVGGVEEETEHLKRTLREMRRGVAGAASRVELKALAMAELMHADPVAAEAEAMAFHESLESSNGELETLGLRELETMAAILLLALAKKGRR